MISFRGRCGFIVYMPNKPCKYGLLIRNMSDAKSKYMLTNHAYAGLAKQPDAQYHLKGPQVVVMHLLKPVYQTDWPKRDGRPLLLISRSS